MINVQNVLKRYDEEEKAAILDALLEEAAPASTKPVELTFFAELYDEAEKIAEHGNEMAGLSTGFPSIDKMTLGLGPGDIIVIFGYTSMGKSQLSQNIALNVAKAGVPVLFIGLELTNKQNSARFIKMGGTDRQLPFLFPADPDISYTGIQAAIKKAKGYGAGLVVVDQLQDLIHDKANEQGEITQIMAELKRAAIINEIPVIVISHVNRTGAVPGPPPLEVLKGSSSIEQKADIAISVYQNHEAQPGDRTHKRMLVALRKNRNRGMERDRAILVVERDMSLHEELDISSLTSMFPGAKLQA